jgi:hypothetical protein
MRATGDNPEGVRLRGIIVVLWRAGPRISAALASNQVDLDPDRAAVRLRHGQEDQRLEVGMDRWAWSHLDPGREFRKELPAGRPFRIVGGPTRGRAEIIAAVHERSALMIPTDSRTAPRR